MAEWTIMFYMAGDNNLSENMALALEGLQSFRQTTETEGKVNLLAYFDGNSLTAPTHYFDYSEAETYKHPMKKEDRVFSGATPDGDSEGEDDSASASSILNFVYWCLKTRNRKAANYAIIFSAHSFGFHGTSFLRDDSSGSFMTLFEFRRTLEIINREFIGAGKKIAILGFDSCVMSMLEVGYELKDVARTIIASEGSLPNSGWGYAPMLKNFVASFDKEEADCKNNVDYIKKAAQGFVTAFIELYKDLAIGGRSVDISAWDLARIEPVASGVNQLAMELNEHLDIVERIKENQLTDDDIAVYQELKKIVLQSHYDAQTYMKEQCVDLKDFCQRLIIECKFLEKGKHGRVFSAIIQRCRDIIVAINKCVLKSGYSGEEYQFSNGISLYFPWTQVTYLLTDYRYRWLLFNKGFTDDGEPNEDLENPTGIGKEWNHFLRNYLSRVTLRGGRKDERGKISMFNDFSPDSPVWSAKDPVSSQANPHWSIENPRWSKDNPGWSKDNPGWSKDNPGWSKGEAGEYLFYFGRFKNFQLGWDINGYADEAEFDEKFK
ncbi:MAG: clostripain-related cysteine peptidase [Pyrinomonadaceae bacterium]